MTDPNIPRLKIRSDYLAALLITLAPIVYFLFAISQGRVFCPDDGLLQNVPFRVAAAQILLSGHLPLWNPYIFSGMPLLGAAQVGLLFPLNWFYLFSSASTATDLMVVSSYMVAGLGAFLYARRIGISIVGAMITGLVWQESGALIGQIAHINIVHTSALLPWILWSLEAYAQENKYKHAVWLAVLTAIQVFAGHPQALAYSLILVGVYALTMAAVNPGLRKSYLSCLILIALGILLSAVQIVPTIELLRHSQRVSATYEFFTSFSMPKRFVLSFLAPFVRGGGDGRLFKAPYLGPQFYQEMIGYVSVLAIMLSGVALLVRSDIRTKFWGIVALACLLLAFGGYAPLGLYRLVYYVPILNLFRVPARHLMEVDFALAVLAGRGFTTLTRYRRDAKTLTRVMIAGSVVFVLTILTVTFFRPADFHLGRQAPVSVLRAPELFLPILISLASVVVLWAYTKGRRGSTILIFVVLAFDLVSWGHSSGWHVGSPRRTDEYWRTPESVQRIRELGATDMSTYRILTAPHSFDPRTAPVAPSVSHSPDWSLWTQPDVYMMHGIPNAAGYDGFGLSRYLELAGRMKVWGELMDPDLTLRSGSREVDLLNVRYLLSLREQSVAVANKKQISFGPAPVEFGNAKFAAEDLGLPNLEVGKRLTFTVPEITCDRISLVTNLSWAENIPEGTVIAHVRLVSSDDREFEVQLRAGTHTAEWAYDRPDIRARIKHSHPIVATSYQVKADSGSYQAHTYVASFTFPEKMQIESGEIRLEAVTYAPDLMLSVYRISLADSGQGADYPLKRDWITVEKQPSSQTALRNSSPTARWKQVARTPWADIYENKQALPRAWVVSEVRVLDQQSMLDVIRKGKFSDGSLWDPRHTALIENPLAESVQTGNGEAQITRYEPNRIELSASLKTPALLVLSENHYPGWNTYVDGNAVETLRVDYNLRGVPLPAGSHRVEFLYRPKSVLLGLVLSLIAASLLAFWGWLRRRSARTLNSKNIKFATEST